MLSNQAKIESLIFVSGNEGITVTELAQLCGIMKPAVLEQLNKLQEKYTSDKSCSFQLYQTGDHFKLTTKKSFASLVKNYFESPTMTTLSTQALETLAIVAYKQPITRTEIDEIRGVQSSGMLQKLTAFDLVEERERSQAPGRPILYGTTEEFLNYFGLTSLKQLPEIKQEDPEKAFNVDNLMGLFEKTVASDESRKREEDND
ncbi:segregation and condensation protein B [Ligilactobacillus acidipiscis DSM 15836]|uniref:Segregation and condensation protein B n=1 Tax=Ligilactobacillus acidipiscis DSM 15836 TaxID=1423716 RepID=A0ABR5PIZ2_9LACO|nr:SMC-Scp complex subunit ScpB [Ligilactobacillus acidipiscis]KRM26215.1 segregation and condensation protein B [Ligilactobacillus acidipiscis DSM 15836]GAW63815.1 segregation and condensation protein ScpB [Ligilactobacillus acidipiscis]GEN21523.1 segregation and condensation protein B [Ligilactobacillus acidipiscis]